MNFDFDEKESSLAAQIKSLIDAGAEARLRNLKSGEPLECLNVFMDYLSRLAQTGYLGLGLRTGKNSTALVAAQESLSDVSPSLFLSIEANVRIFGRLVAAYGTSGHKAEILPLLEHGSYIGSVALSEGGMSPEKETQKTEVLLSGENIMVTGVKEHVVNAPLADRIAVVANAPDGAVVVLVKPEWRGVAIGERFSTLGYEGTPIAPITFDHVAVPRSDVMGPFGDFQLTDSLRRWEDQILTAAGLGLMKRSYRAALTYAKETQRGGKPIIAYQEVGFKLAEMLTLQESARLLAYRAAWMDESDHRERDVLGCCAKVFCSESAEHIASEALQILGNSGFVRGNPAEGSYRNAKYLQIAGTSSEISRSNIGDRVLESVN